jgi:hypothetical protein
MVCILHTKKEAGVLGVGDVLAMGFQEYIYIYLELMMYLVPHLPFHNSFLLSYCTQFLPPPFSFIIIIIITDSVKRLKPPSQRPPYSFAGPSHLGPDPASKNLGF